MRAAENRFGVTRDAEQNREVVRLQVGPYLSASGVPEPNDGCGRKYCYPLI
jgi:hypothetical protein